MAAGESTVPVTDDDDDDDDSSSGPFLPLTFDLGPRSGIGFMFGRDRDYCDILLPTQNRRVSGRHCCITFDEQQQLVLRDFSTHGTKVTYNGQGAEKRRGFTWLLNHENLEQGTKIVINIQGIRFRITTPKHETTCQPLYKANVEQFLLQARIDDELPLSGLGIQSTSTTAYHSGADTPQARILINRGQLGEGSYSTVERVWDVGTGQLYALKKIKNSDQFDWKRETKILRRVSQLGNV